MFKYLFVVNSNEYLFVRAFLHHTKKVNFKLLVIIRIPVNIITCTCYECHEYYVDDKKYLINIGEKYYCMICFQNKPDFFIKIFKKLCEINDIDTVNKIIKYGIDMNVCGTCGNTLFAFACWTSGEIAKILINIGVQLDTKSKSNCTPFHFACMKIPEIAKILINKGVSLDTEVHKGKRPIHYCEKNSEVYNMLIDAGCKP